jgi:hypothetical protein
MHYFLFNYRCKSDANCALFNHDEHDQFLIAFPCIPLLVFYSLNYVFVCMSLVCCDQEGGSDGEDADLGRPAKSGNVARRSPDDPDRNTEGNNFTQFLATLCHGLFDQSAVGEDMVTGYEGSLLYAIIHNQRPRHWNN